MLHDLIPRTFLAGGINHVKEKKGKKALGVQQLLGILLNEAGMLAAFLTSPNSYPTMLVCLM